VSSSGLKGFTRIGPKKPDVIAVTLPKFDVCQTAFVRASNCSPQPADLEGVINSQLRPEGSLNQPVTQANEKPLAALAFPSRRFAIRRFWLGQFW
jgi:hypothetical protein